MLIHHTNLAEAQPDKRKLVCYDCGVACDLVKMRQDRLVALRVLGAEDKPAPRGAHVDAGGVLVDVSERGGGSTAEVEVKASRDRETDRAERVRLNGHYLAGLPWTTYRIRFAKVGRAAFLGHLDLVRLLGRTFRRADLSLAMTRGFNPKPRISFGPALGLGVPSLGELVDIDLEHAPRGRRTWEAAEGDERVELTADEVRERLASVCPPGIEVHDCKIVRLSGHPLAGQRPDLGLGKLISAVDVLLKPAPDGMAHDAARLERIVTAFLAKDTAIVARGEKQIDVRGLVITVDVIAGEAATKLAAALDWGDTPAIVRARVRATAEGSAKPSEIARALGIWGSDDLRGAHAMVARLGVVDDVAAPILPGSAKPLHAVIA
jgi:radical SAM-linked protein